MAKVTKVSIQAVVTTAGGFTYTADDAQNPGAGTGVLGAVVAKRDIDSLIGTTRTYIPYDAIDHVVITKTTSQADAPEDETCVVETESDDSEGGDTPDTPDNP